MKRIQRTPELVEEVLARLSNGEPLAQICRDDHMPSRRMWGFWCEEDPELKKLHGLARDDGYDMIAADMLRIADTPVEGVEIVEKPTGTEVRKGDMLGHRRLQIETRDKLLAKWDPRRYGNKLAVGGAEDLPPIKTMTDEQLAARIALLQATVNGDKG